MCVCVRERERKERMRNEGILIQQYDIIEVAQNFPQRIQALM